MKTMKLGKTGMDISRIGLGTWSIGGGSAWGGDHDLQTVVDTIREAPKAGVNLIDTAPGYNFGNSEKILGKALEGMNREDVKIITKCGVTWDQEMKGDLFNKVNGIQLYKNLNSESVKKEIEASLERLGTDYVDVIIIGATDPSSGIETGKKHLEKIVGDSKQLADWLAKNYSTHYTCKAEDMTVNSANRVNKIVFKKVND